MGAGVVGLIVGWATPRSWWTRRTPRPDPLRSSPSTYDWRAQPEPTFPLPPYARFLEDVSVVLDPGHGGRADRKNWKRGPTGLREATVNLRVALFLREFLEAVGARVTLTRDKDVFLHDNDSEDLRLRAELGNWLNADLLLSIHHNASDNSVQSNYTSVFYHGEPDDNPASLDAARHLLAGLHEALRLEQHLGCPLVSDYAVFPGKGFAILRHARVPAVLTEASFHSNPQEERRLRDPVYNRREAYGLFLGLARWAQAGLPRVRLAQPADRSIRTSTVIVVRLDDGLSARGGFGHALPKIAANSLMVRLDDQPVTATVDWAAGKLRVRPASGLSSGTHYLYVNFANIFGQHVLHPWIELKVARPG